MAARCGGAWVAASHSSLRRKRSRTFRPYRSTAAGPPPIDRVVAVVLFMTERVEHTAGRVLAPHVLHYEISNGRRRTRAVRTPRPARATCCTANASGEPGNRPLVGDRRPNRARCRPAWLQARWPLSAPSSSLPRLGCPWAREGPDRATTSADGIAIWAMLACRLVKGSSFLIKPPRRLLRHDGVPRSLHPDRATANEDLRSPHPSSGFARPPNPVPLSAPTLSDCRRTPGVATDTVSGPRRRPCGSGGRRAAHLEIASNNASDIALESAAGVA